jgi:hypothetical protein
MELPPQLPAKSVHSAIPEPQEPIFGRPDYLPEAASLSPDLQESAELLLAPDMLMLLLERNLISADFANKIVEQKNDLKEEIDVFLKSVISLMEQIRGRLDRKIELFHSSFEGFYNDYVKTVEIALRKSNEILQKSAIDPVSGTQSEFWQGDSLASGYSKIPLKPEVEFLKKNREETKAIEKTFKTIQDLMAGYGLAKMRDTLDQKLSDPNLPYNSKFLKMKLNTIHSNLTQKLMSSDELEGEQIVSKFKKPQTTGITSKINASDILSNLESGRQETLEEEKESAYEASKRSIQDALMKRSPRPDSTNQKLVINISSPIDSKNPKKQKSSSKYQRKPKRSKKRSAKISARTGKTPKNHSKSRKAAFLSPSPIPSSQKATPSILKGLPSLAKISEDRLEINIHFDPINSSFKNKKNYSLNGIGTVNCVSALDSRNIIIGGSKGVVSIVDLQDHHNYIKRSVNLGQPITALVAFGHSKKQAVIGLGSNKGPKALVILDYSKDCSSEIFNFSKIKGCITDIAFIDQRTFFTSSTKGVIQMWKVNQKMPIIDIRIHDSKISSIDFMKLSGFLLTGGDDCRFNLFKLEKEKEELASVRVYKENGPISLVKGFRRNTSHALTGMEDGSIKLWDLVDNR